MKKVFSERSETVWQLIFSSARWWTGMSHRSGPVQIGLEFCESGVRRKAPIPFLGWASSSFSHLLYMLKYLNALGEKSLLHRLQSAKEKSFLSWIVVPMQNQCQQIVAIVATYIDLFQSVKSVSWWLCYCELRGAAWCQFSLPTSHRCSSDHHALQFDTPQQSSTLLFKVLLWSKSKAQQGNSLCPGRTVTTLELWFSPSKSS